MHACGYACTVHTVCMALPYQVGVMGHFPCITLLCPAFHGKHSLSLCSSASTCQEPRGGSLCERLCDVHRGKSQRSTGLVVTPLLGEPPTSDTTGCCPCLLACAGADAHSQWLPVLVQLHGAGAAHCCAGRPALEAQRRVDGGEPGSTNASSLRLARHLI
jgi:hypothetical protein